MALPDPRTAAGRAGLAALIAEPARALVALDFDGTLAPIVTNPQDSRPGPGALAALQALAGRVGALVVVTGRPADVVVELGGLDAVPGLTVLGHYGLQRWYAGQLTSPEPEPGVAAARAALPGLLSDAPDGVSVEDKTHSLAVHTRPAADPQAAMDALTGPLQALAAAHGLELVPGRLVLELRPPGVDKGSALTGFAREREAGAVLFAGDDLGDLPAYAAVEALRTGGVPGITVCAADPAEAPAPLRDRADLVVDGPAGVVTLLEALAGALGDG